MSSDAVRRAVVKMLMQSLTSDQICRIARETDRKCDPAKMSGFGPNIRIPARVAADCVAEFFPDAKDLLRFVGQVMKHEGEQMAGTRLWIHEKGPFLRTLAEIGWVYDSQAARFILDQRSEATADWGFLQEGQEVRLSFASIDIVGSSSLPGSRSEVGETLKEFRRYAKKYIELWNGRLWKWRGDGGLAAFQGHDSPNRSVLAMVGIQSNLPVFHVAHSRLPDGAPPAVRIGIHYGAAEYANDPEQIYSRDIELAGSVERHACPPNGIAITDAMRNLLKSEILIHFRTEATYPGGRAYLFRRHGADL